MNIARNTMADFLWLVKPWMNEWRVSDFANAEVIGSRMAPTHTIFPIPTRPLPGMLERMLLGAQRARALDILIACIGKFNASLDKLNSMPLEHKMEYTIFLHAGVIGQRGQGGLFDAFEEAERVL